jgi:Asp-tRNA(Asn)/Glu-tRNA(Gln) amidotransferase A subunit family amidase
MTLDDYRQSLAALEKLRAAFAAIEGKADACLTLSTPTPPPIGNATGNSVYGDPSSCLEAPAWNLPLLENQGLPLGIQLLGHPHDDYALGCIGQWMMEVFVGRG